MGYLRKKISLAFGAADTSKSETLRDIGNLQHLHLRVPNFTNVVTATVSLADEDGYVFYTSAAKARNANYNLEAETEWHEQLLTGQNVTLTVTLSEAPGGDGGMVILVPRLQKC